ncbi:RidA family protein [Coraliomargarita parva]|uniref:RidA family protein n=1 Tax=Coraliomargarita parva TaxID=3014050 RepID=UPI0022B519F0|nr:RidA family protein [Coraliomargarita parva]
MSAEAKLKELAIELPTPPSPGGNYLSHRRMGNVLTLAGIISFSSTGEQWTGQVGDERSLDDGYAAAKVCALNVLATIRDITGSLDAVKQFLYVGGYVNAIPNYGQSPSVINGASDLFEAVFGEPGKHARAAVSVAGLPKNATVEIQVNVELKDGA